MGPIVAAARGADPESIKTLIQANAGFMRGHTLMSAWSARGLKEPGAADVLQSDDASEELVARFRVWHAWTLDLPGSYYLQVFEDLFRRNKLARGEFDYL